MSITVYANVSEIKCEDPRIKNILINTFKNKSTYFRAIDPKTISTITIEDPIPDSYDNTIGKYYCRAKIIMKSIHSGFMPNINVYDNYNVGNSFLEKMAFATIYGDPKPNNMAYLKRYDTYIVHILYTAQIANGEKIIVQDNMKQFSYLLVIHKNKN